MGGVRYLGLIVRLAMEVLAIVQEETFAKTISPRPSSSKLPQVSAPGSAPAAPG